MQSHSQDDHQTSAQTSMWILVGLVLSLHLPTDEIGGGTGGRELATSLRSLCSEAEEALDRVPVRMHTGLLLAVRL